MDTCVAMLHIVPFNVGVIRCEYMHCNVTHFEIIIVKDSFSRREIVENQIRTNIANLDPRAFETLLINMFDQIPHVDDPFVRKQSHDGGFEMSLRITDPITGSAEWILVQAKFQPCNLLTIP